MGMHHDTIVALSSGLRGAAIALIRVSGSEAHAALQHLCSDRDSTIEPRRAALRKLHADGEFVDEAIVTLYSSPRSYTGEDMVELACHASPYIVERLIGSLITFGLRYARPGEFTERAYLNGKLDLTQAEAIHDLILSTTKAQHRLATGQMQGQVAAEVQALRAHLLELASLLELELDFSEEDVEFANREELLQLTVQNAHRIDQLINSYQKGKALRDGIPVAIVGPPNAGKSTLLNYLIQEERAIVSPIPGTTRDVVEGTREMHGALFHFADTAGIRATEDIVEAEGIMRAKQRMEGALLVLLVVEAEEFLKLGSYQRLAQQYDPPSTAQTVVILSKIDTLTPSMLEDLKSIEWDGAIALNPILWSAKSEEGGEAIGRLFADMADTFQREEEVLITNQRHHEALLRAKEEFALLQEQIALGSTQDLLAFHCRAAVKHLGSITGEMDVEEILGNIFSHFCIGK